MSERVITKACAVNETAENDTSSEAASLTRAQILTMAGTAILAQKIMAREVVLKMLGLGPDSDQAAPAAAVMTLDDVEKPVFGL